MSRMLGSPTLPTLPSPPPPFPYLTAARRCSPQHFFEKLLHLKEMMKTDAGKECAEGRHRHMEAFLSQLFGELRGEM